MPETPEAIYQRPSDYDLEHVGDTDDIEFFVSLLGRLKPQRVLELACGNGRVTVPLAEAGAREGFDVVGLELVPEMLEAARKRQEEASSAAQERLSLAEGDMRTWKAEQPFDVIVTPCSSVCHLLTLEDQLAAWRCAYENLLPGGRFVVDVTMPDQGAYADSFRSPARELVEVDLDTFDEATQTRLIRYKTTRYLAHEQRASIRFLYDKFVADAPPERSISDFQSHVYYPREMQLLFMQTGFEVETFYGDYRSRPLGPNSPQMIFCGVKSR
ncbi:MAG: class I SAM-dependent methyltransferase [Abitibacteriaceae bacterium]|nr:class I SAM-dependent methyltransferase [Abditibacteriaceae bacterium]MBV9866249.1 class I SAM-dependent methyltransferase [Abditibacteriaceae bacterium]